MAGVRAAAKVSLPTPHKETRMARKLLSRENIYAVLLCLILIAVLILTTEQAPAWIYQGF